MGSLLVRLTGPMILGIVSMVLFNLADTFFVSRLSGRHLAALSFTYPVVLIVNSLALGLGMGASAVISRAVGRRDHAAARRLTTDSLSLALLIVGLFVIAGLATIGPVFRLLGASDETLTLIRSYMGIWYPGMVFVVVPMVGNNAIRARGDTLTPGLIMLASATINTVLDPLLIFGWGPFPRLEMAGAALATVMARASSLVLALWVLIRRERLLCLVRPTLAEVLTSWRQILYLGLPTATTRLVTPLGMGIVTRMAAAHGEPVVAALGVGSRLEFFGLTVVAALSTVLAPFVGQNLGAGQSDRVRQGVNWASRFALIWGRRRCPGFGGFRPPAGNALQPRCPGRHAHHGLSALGALGLWGVGTDPGGRLGPDGDGPPPVGGGADDDPGGGPHDAPGLGPVQEPWTHGSFSGRGPGLRPHGRHRPLAPAPEATSPSPRKKSVVPWPDQGGPASIIDTSTPEPEGAHDREKPAWRH